MKRSMYFLLGILAIGAASAAFAQAPAPGPAIIEKFALSAGYAPVGFDTINQSQVVVEGYLPDSCHKAGPANAQINGFNIVVTQGVYKYTGGACLDVISPFFKVIDLGILREGNYNVIDGATGKLLTTLPIVKAPFKSPKTYPDDFLYAAVTDATIIHQSGRHTLVIHGVYSDNCTKMTDIRVKTIRNVVQVQPITERPDRRCAVYPTRFQLTKPIDSPNGHYLLHVRSLNGNAVNKIVDF